jgi:hypothetical protein
MNNHSRISKMFGVLVLGGGVLVQPPQVNGEPTSKDVLKNDALNQPMSKLKVAPTNELTADDQKPQETSKKEQIDDQKPPPLVNSRMITHDQPHCQLEITLHQYDSKGHSQTQTKTCLDNKSETEIIKFIKTSREKTCQTPFCGCWLG